LRVFPENAAGLIIDLQDKLLPHMYNAKVLEENCKKLITGLAILEIPLVASEQYPKGLGHTIKPIQELIPDFKAVEKLSFSCCRDDNFRKVMRNIGKRMIIICGVEAHVCVLQSAIDMVEIGYQPVIVEDCISSRRESDKKTALKRMIQEKVIVTSYESILFELCLQAGTDTFKKISQLVK
jgi:nicotinamidase-related amidase